MTTVSFQEVLKRTKAFLEAAFSLGERPHHFTFLTGAQLSWVDLPLRRTCAVSALALRLVLRHMGVYDNKGPLFSTPK